MKKLMIFLAFFLLLAAQAFAQVSIDTTGIGSIDPLSPPSIANMLDTFNILYAGLVILWGYIAKLLNLQIKNANFVFTILAGAIVLGGLFLVTNIGQALPLVFSFLSSLGIYDLILKPAKLTIPNENVSA